MVYCVLKEQKLGILKEGEMTLCRIMEGRLSGDGRWKEDVCHLGANYVGYVYAEA